MSRPISSGLSTMGSRRTALGKGICSSLAPTHDFMTQAGVGPSSWTDAYLAAFAEAHSYAMVTFDTGFERWPALKLTLLTFAQDRLFAPGIGKSLTTRRGSFRERRYEDVSMPSPALLNFRKRELTAGATESASQNRRAG